MKVFRNQVEEEAKVVVVSITSKVEFWLKKGKKEKGKNEKEKKLRN